MKLLILRFQLVTKQPVNSYSYDFKKEYRLTSRVQPEKSLMPQAYNVHPPQAYSVHPPQAKEQQNNPLSSSSSTIPYSVKENNSKKRRVVHGQCTQSKKPKIVDPKLSLPEESDMGNKIGDLLYNDNLNESDDDSTLKDDNEDFDDMLQALSNEVLMKRALQLGKT